MRIHGRSVPLILPYRGTLGMNGYLTVLGLAGLLGCSTDWQSTEAADFDYSRLVSEDPGSRVSLELIRQAVLDFPVSSMVNWHSDTSFALIESQEQRGIILGLDGQVIAARGRKGTGPGELTGGIQLFPGREGEMAVVDLALNRVTVFNADASPGATISISGRPIKLLGFSTETLTVLVHGTASNAVAYYSPLSGELLGEIDLEPLGTEPVVGGNHSSPGVAVVAKDDSSNLYLADPFDYRIVQLSGGLSVRSSLTTPEIEPLYLSDDAIAARTEGALRGLEGVSGAMRSQAAKALETTLSAQQPHFGPYSITAGGGWVFVVRRLASGKASVIDVFGDGKLLGSFPFPLVIQGIDGSAGRIAFIASPDPFGVDHEQILFTYRFVAE